MHTEQPDLHGMRQALVGMLADGELDLPLPAGGGTELRFRRLAEIAAVDLSLARLAEGHVDALAILAEANRPEQPGSYGVWAAEPPDAKVSATRSARGWRLSGCKRYASGARSIDRALVTASAHDGPRLFDVALRSEGIQPIDGTWNAIGMAATDSLDVTFDVEVDERAAVGAPGFYFERTGFWHGAVGVAACWYGGGLGAYRMLLSRLRRGPMNVHALAHLGAAHATCEAMWSAITAAAKAIDALDGAGDPEGRRRALVVRHVVEQGCVQVLSHVGRASGSSCLVFDRVHARRVADLTVYLRQSHAESDLALLGKNLVEAPCD